MGNYLKMIDKQRIQALLDLGWSYRKIERETGVRRETISSYDPRHVLKAAKVSPGEMAKPAFGFPARMTRTQLKLPLMDQILFLPGPQMAVR